jgi:hypothetical protein
MNSTRISRRLVAGCAAAFALVASGCDTKPLTSAIDSFRISVGFPAIKTVIGGQVVDAGTLKPITVPVTLTFGGTNASHLIDAFSDPLTTQTIDRGQLVLGLDSITTPTAESPTTFTVTAAASGYVTRTETVSITDVGSAGFVIALMPNTATSTITGTAGATATGSATNGVAAATTTVTTAPLPGATAASTLQIPQGATLTTASGTPLSGTVTAQIRAISTSAIDALPPETRVSNGTTLAAVAGVAIDIRDAAGNIAGVSGSSVAAAANRVSDGSLLAVSSIQAFVGLSATEFARIQSLIDGGATMSVRNVAGIVAGCSAALDAGRKGVAFTGSCVGNLSAVVNPATAPTACTIRATFPVTNPNAAKVRLLRTIVSSPSIYAAKQESGEFRPGNVGNLSFANVVYSSQVPAGSNYTVSIETDAGVATVTNVNLCASTSYPLTVPINANVATYSAVATVSCPAGQRFNPAVSRASLDGLQVFYRATTGDGVPTLASRNGLDKTVSTNSISVSGSVGLIRGTSYDVDVTFGSKSGSQTVTAPTSGTSIPVSLSAESVGLTCK